MEEETKDFDPVNDDTCPYCGCSDLDCDLVVTEDESGEEIRYDVIDCPQCCKRLWAEDYEV